MTKKLLLKRRPEGKVLQAGKPCSGFLVSLLLLVALFFYAFALLPAAGRVEASQTKPLRELSIGEKVVDQSWHWQFRTGRNYGEEAGNLTRPVTWIVVAKDHYGQGSGVTLMSAELIGYYTFDNSKDRGSDQGSNHWGNSGTTGATRGLRPWLNSSSLHAGEGFYRALSTSFKNAVLTTTLPNRTWNGVFYTTEDKVFIPSFTELGQTVHVFTHVIGTTFPYFSGASEAKRAARLAGVETQYWTRSPSNNSSYYVQLASSDFKTAASSGGVGAARPVVNLASSTPVFATPNAQGIYVLAFETTPLLGDVNRDGQINVLDVTLVIRYILEHETLSAEQKALADVNRDGLINIVDATLIMQKALNLIDTFPAG